MRNKKTERKNLSKKKKKPVTKIAQISPGEGLSEGLRGLMENSGDSASDSGELRGELRNSGNSYHPFWRTQEGTQGAPPLGVVGACAVTIHVEACTVTLMALVDAGAVTLKAAVVAGAVRSSMQ